MTEFKITESGAWQIAGGRVSEERNYMKTKNGCLTALAGIVLAGLVAAQPGAAASVTNGFFFAAVTAPSVSRHNCVGVDILCTSTDAYGTVTAEAGGSQSAFAVADGSNNYGLSGGGGQGFAHEFYYFRINGPDATVPISIAYSMTANRFDADSLAITQLEVAGNLVHTLATSQGTSGTFSDAPTFGVAANSDVKIDMLSSGTNNFHSYVTTFVAIDPQFLLDNPNGGYSLQFSSGITNSSSTEAGAPEPGTVVLMGGALAGMVALKRKRGQF